MSSSGQFPWIHNRLAVDRGDVPRATSPSASPAARPPGPSRWRSRVLPVLLVIAILGLWVWHGRRARQANAPGGQTIATAKIELHPFIHKLRLNGTVEAVESTALLCPTLVGSANSRLIITHLVANGTRVKKGDFLVEFDRQEQLKTALDKQAEYRNLEDQLQEKIAGQEAARVHDETELKKAEDDLAKARLEMQRNEVISRIDAERNRLILEEDEAQLKQLRQTFLLKRRAAEADRKGLEIQRDRARDAMEMARRNAEQMSLNSPADGLVVFKPAWRGGNIGDLQEGDQVYPGYAFLDVVDTSAMQVRARVNQVDMPALHVGQPVEARLDAYPDTVYSGKVEEIAVIGVHGDFSESVRVFPVLFSIQGSDAKLMPDLTAAVDVEIARQPQALVAPRDAIVHEGGKTWAWVKGASGFEKRAVKAGAMDDVSVVIESGLDAGDVVERRPPGTAGGS